jgi:phosphohistidine phosphatase
MKLYLVRHGEATSEEVYPKRPMTERGSLDVSGMAKFAEEISLRVLLIWQSTKLRAKQTADLFATVLRPEEEMRERSGLWLPMIRSSPCWKS